MSKDWRAILGFSILGLVVATIFFVFDKTDFFSKSWVGVCIFWASLALCPGFFALVLDVAGSELPVSNPMLAWLLIMVFNCIYYASIGVVYVDMRKPRCRTAKI